MVNINKVVVIGAGTMGSGIALVGLIAQKAVVVIDVAKESLDKAKQTITKSLEKSYSKGKITQDPAELLKNLELSSDFASISDADLIIEAVSEDMNIKKKVFQAISDNSKEDAIIASNTSALKISDLAKLYKKPENVLGMHFFNPVFLMKLVELIKTETTSQAIFDISKQFVIELGKEPIEVKESSGFVVNRLLVPMINEAAMVYGEKVASAEDIDKAMKLGANHPIGPLALADLIGIDVCQAIMETLSNDLGQVKYQPAPILKELIDAGKMGKKSGEGFYKY